MSLEKVRAHVAHVEAKLRHGIQLNVEGRKALRTLKAFLLEHDYGAGAVEARRCRASGARRVLYRPGTQAEADEGWLVICETHAYTLCTVTRRLGSSALADPEWCEQCQEIVARKNGAS